MGGGGEEATLKYFAAANDACIIDLWFGGNAQKVSGVATLTSTRRTEIKQNLQFFYSFE